MKTIFHSIVILLIISLDGCSLHYSHIGRGIDDEYYMKKQRIISYELTAEEDSMMQILNFWQVKDTQFVIDYKLHKKAVKKYNKLVNGGGKDIIGGRKTYKRMKKSKKQAKYIRRD